MKLAVLPATLVAAGLLLSAAPASAQEVPPIPPILDLVTGKPIVLEDQCVVTYVDGRWEVVCVPYGHVDRVQIFAP